MPCPLHCEDMAIAPPPSVSLGNSGAGAVEVEHGSHQLWEIEVMFPAPVLPSTAVIKVHGPALSWGKTRESTRDYSGSVFVNDWMDFICRHIKGNFVFDRSRTNTCRATSPEDTGNLHWSFHVIIKTTHGFVREHSDIQKGVPGHRW